MIVRGIRHNDSIMDFKFQQNFDFFVCISVSTKPIQNYKLLLDIIGEDRNVVALKGKQREIDLVQHTITI